MFSVFLQNLALIIVSLIILVNHKADYTLYMAIAVILVTSFRILFTNDLSPTRVNYFLIQGLIFSVAIWFVLYPRQFYNLFG